MSDKRPKRTREQEIGDRALREFNSRSPDRWVIDEMNKDYGRDFIITIAKSESIKDEFNAQIKGTEKPDYSKDGDFISFSLEVSTVNYLLNMEEPSMLVICDVGHTDKPVYWVWLNEDIKRIKANNPKWRVQETVTFRVPTLNVLTEDAHDEIESYVHEYLTMQKYDKAAGAVIRSIYHKDPLTLTEKYGDSSDEYVVEEVIKPLGSTGSFSVSVTESGAEITTYTEDEKQLLKKLDQISTYVNSTQDKLAKEIIDDIEDEIEKSEHKEIRARFLNSKGVLV